MTHEELSALSKRIRDEQDKFLLACDEVQYKPFHDSDQESILQRLEENFKQSFELLLIAQQQEFRALYAHHAAQKKSGRIDLDILSGQQERDIQDLEDEHLKIQQDFTQKCEEVKATLAKFYDSKPIQGVAN